MLLLSVMLGGDITVQSKAGTECMFRVTVPTGSLQGVSFSDNLQWTMVEDASAQPRLKLHCRILLAEDGADNQRLLTLVLQKAGATVTLAQNGREAVELALASCPGRGRRHNDPLEPFDIVLMDIQMPEIDGYEATRRLREKGYAVPIIALSAHATTHASHKCLGAGCTDYLAKPIDRDALLRMIARHVEKKNETDENSSREGVVYASN